MNRNHLKLAALAALACCAVLAGCAAPGPVKESHRPDWVLKGSTITSSSVEAVGVVSGIKNAGLAAKVAKDRALIEMTTIVKSMPGDKACRRRALGNAIAVDHWRSSSGDMYALVRLAGSELRPCGTPLGATPDEAEKAAAQPAQPQSARAEEKPAPSDAKQWWQQ